MERANASQVHMLRPLSLDMMSSRWDLDMLCTCGDLCLTLQTPVPLDPLKIASGPGIADLEVKSYWP